MLWVHIFLFDFFVGVLLNRKCDRDISNLFGMHKKASFAVKCANMQCYHKAISAKSTLTH